MPVKNKKTGKGKRRPNGRRRNKEQRKVIPKTNSTTKPRKYEKSEIKDEYHCFVSNKDRNVLWSVLNVNDAFINFYLDKLGELEGLPYDSLNIFSYHKIKKCSFDSNYALRLIRQNENDQDVLYTFISKYDRDYWCQQIQSIISNSFNGKSDIDILKNYNDSNLLYFGEVLLFYQPFICILSTCSNTLYFYKKYHNKYKKRILFKKIDLLNFKDVILTKNENDSYSLFKYKLILKRNDSNNTELWFKKNNERQEWFAHLDFIINHKINPVMDDDINIDEVNNNENEKSLSLILDMMMNENINISYHNLLNHFNHIIRYFNSNNVDDKIFKSVNCTDIDCEYNINRNQMRRRNKNKTLKRDKKLLMTELLDKIHCFIFHSNRRTAINMIRPNLKNKFVINITENEDIESKVMEEMEDIDNVKNDELFTFAFGEPFSFESLHDNIGQNNHLNPHYLTLKEELTNNPYYQLTIDEYYYYYMKALNIQKTKQFIDIKGIDTGTNQGKIAEIGENDKISINHIISLMTYCNEDELQRIFKKQIRRMNEYQSKEKLFKRVSFIAHWLRYLYESCTCYGKQMKSTEVVYCGINRKLIFDTFNITNYLPLSTSCNISVANNFATHNGIILKLKSHGNGLNCRYFNMQFISDYVDEKELFFCGMARLSIQDIIINGKSNFHTISSLKLLESILTGIIFVYKFNRSQFTQNSINGLVVLLDQHNKQNNNDYFVQLLTALIQSYLDRNKENDPFGRKIIFINLPEIKKLNNDVLLAHFNEPSSILMNTFNGKNIKINYIKKIFKFQLDKKKINKLKKMKHDECDELILGHFAMKQMQFECSVVKVNADYFGIQMNATSKTLPFPFPKIDILLDVVCQQIKYKAIQIHRPFSLITNYFAGIKMFECSKLCGLHSLSIDINMRVIE